MSVSAPSHLALTAQRLIELGPEYVAHERVLFVVLQLLGALSEQDDPTLALLVVRLILAYELTITNA